MSLWGQIAIDVAGLIAICGMGFILGFSKNRVISEPDLARELATREPNKAIKKYWLSHNKSVALLATSDALYYLLKSHGDELSLREISPKQISVNNNEIVIDVNDIGFPRFTSKFAENDIKEIVGVMALGAAA